MPSFKTWNTNLILLKLHSNKHKIKKDKFKSMSLFFKKTKKNNKNSTMK